MSTINEVYRRAVAKFGADQVGGMCNTLGGFDGTLNTVPKSRHDELAGVLNRMMGSPRAMAQAREDFETLDAAKSRAKRERSQPETLDSAAIFNRWNQKSPRDE